MMSRLASASTITVSRLVWISQSAPNFVAIRQRGFAETVDELEDGFSGVGTIIRGGLGEVLGTLSICGPTQRMTAARRARLGESLRVAAAQLQPALH